MCGRFALNLNAQQLQQAVQEQYIPDLEREFDDTLTHEHQDESHASTSASPSRGSSSSDNVASTYEHGFRTPNYNVSSGSDLSG